MLVSLDLTVGRLVTYQTSSEGYNWHFLDTVTLTYTMKERPVPSTLGLYFDRFFTDISSHHALMNYSRNSVQATRIWKVLWSLRFEKANHNNRIFSLDTSALENCKFVPSTGSPLNLTSLKFFSGVFYYFWALQTWARYTLQYPSSLPLP